MSSCISNEITEDIFKNFKEIMELKHDDKKYVDIFVNNILRKTTFGMRYNKDKAKIKIESINTIMKMTDDEIIQKINDIKNDIKNKEEKHILKKTVQEREREEEIQYSQYIFSQFLSNAKERGKKKRIERDRIEKEEQIERDRIEKERIEREKLQIEKLKIEEKIEIDRIEKLKTEERSKRIREKIKGCGMNNIQRKYQQELKKEIEKERIEKINIENRIRREGLEGLPDTSILLLSDIQVKSLLDKFRT